MPSKVQDQDIVSHNNGIHRMFDAELASEMFAHRMVAAAASRRPDALAILSPQGRLSYRELEARANQLAQHFHAM